MLIENEIIDYKENIKDIEHWVLLKGKYRYEDIIKFLKSKEIECFWENVTYYIKYDKRLLINSFKYIVFLEELFKSFIKKSKDIKTSIILRFEFSKALEEFLSIGDDANYDDMDLNLLLNEKKALISFRNSVVHNKILLNHSYSGKSLEEILNICIKILPKSYRKGYIKDINSCYKDITEKLWHIELKE